MSVPVDPRWSVVHSAARDDPGGARTALGELCAAYWPPAYVWARRLGHDPANAERAVQDVLGGALDDLAAAPPDEGRFRRWMLAALDRGGSTPLVQARAPAVPFDAELAERIHAALATDALSAEQAYERAWARTVLGRALARVRADYAAAGAQAELDTLAPTVLQGAPGSLTAIATRLGASEAAITAAAARLRARYGVRLRDEVADTVASDVDVADELQILVAAVRAPVPSRP